MFGVSGRDVTRLLGGLHRYTAYQKRKMQAVAAGGSRLQFEMETLMGKDDNPNLHMMVEEIGDSLTKVRCMLQQFFFSGTALDTG